MILIFKFIIDCGPLPLVANGSVSLDTSKSTVGSTATVTCAVGFETNQSSIVCQSSGSWDIPFECTTVDCGPLPSATNGSLTLISLNTTVGATANLTCNEGTESNQTQIVCLASGIWEEPLCIARGKTVLFMIYSTHFHIRKTRCFTIKKALYQAAEHKYEKRIFFLEYDRKTQI